MTILVTGAHGFVGLAITQQLLRSGADVVAMDLHPPDAVARNVYAAFGEQVRVVRGDVRDRAACVALVRDLGVGRIVHAAALTPTPDGERDDPTGLLDVNLGGTVNMLEAARAGAVERFVFVSSTAVYGAPDGRALPITEDQPLRIGGIYAIAKQACEHLLARYAELYGLSTVTGRLGTAYGPLERPTTARARMSQVYALLDAALAGRAPTMYGADLPRDVVYADDAAVAFARLALAPRLRWSVYNVGSGAAPSLRDIARAIQHELPAFGWHETDDPTYADLVVLAASARGPLDLSRLRDDLDFVPSYPLPDGLRSAIHSLRNASRAGASERSIL